MRVQARPLPPGVHLLEVAGVPQREWLVLLGERDLFLVPEWLRVGPGTYGGGLRASQAVLLSGTGGPVAATASWMFDQTCTEDLCRPDVLMDLPAADGSALFPTALCGGWYDTRVVARPRRPPTPADMESILTALERWALTQGATSVCWPSVDRRERDLTAALQARGYVSFPLAPR
jgi:uncharacterized protein